MSRVLLAAIVVLGSFGALNALLSLVSIAVWRWGVIGRGGVGAAARARRIFWLRACPAAASAIVVLMLVVPAFIVFEPRGVYEVAGPVITMLAIGGAALWLASLAVAARHLRLGWQFNRNWKATATELEIDPPPGVAAYAFDSPAPIVALVGVVTPRVVAARAVVDACSRDDLMRIIAHERGHLAARDNLKRWLMACAPDWLRWTRAHAEMTAAWTDAAEDSADDAATGGCVSERLDLAALLVKIGRLTPAEMPRSASMSPFVEIDGLERRIRRLVSRDAAAAPSRSDVALPLLACGLAAVLALALFDSATLKQTHDIVETLVHLGR